ncbi:MAG: DUF45 domain-containing protein, partial [Ferrovum sp.]|nr:DUF45 domain-containing protein [Ferrovum sp.]
MRALRALLFVFCQTLVTPVYALLMLATAPWGVRGPRYFAGAWCRLILVLARIICGIRHEITGWENLPSGPFVLISKHQSAWETVFFPAFLRPHSFVLKRELLSIPFFGWGMALLQPIAIDREQRREAFQQVLIQGQARLQNNLIVVIFPEGTRVPFGYRGRYAPGGGILAATAGVPVIPLAHDAGRLWQRGVLGKYPGTIHMAIGPTLHTAGRDGIEVSREAERWIEEQIELWSQQPALPYRRKATTQAARMEPIHQLKRPDGKQVPFIVTRRPRRQTVGLKINASGLTVLAPPRVPHQDIEHLLQQRWNWIEKHLQRFQSAGMSLAPPLSDGAAIPYRGSP